jgi:hypothetical protein
VTWLIVTFVSVGVLVAVGVGWSGAFRLLWTLLAFGVIDSSERTAVVSVVCLADMKIVCNIDGGSGLTGSTHSCAGAADIVNPERSLAK